MINEDFIMKKLQDYAKSSVGKAAIKKAYGIDYDLKKDDRKIAREYAKKMRGILSRYTKEVIGSITEKDIAINEPVFNKDGTGIISISFSDSSLFRTSLQPKGKLVDGKYIGWKGKNVGKDAAGNYGIENIVLHFSHGWNTKGSVIGSWHDIDDVWSRRSYGADTFLQDAVDEFNKTVKKTVKAELIGEYTN